MSDPIQTCPICKRDAVVSEIAGHDAIQVECRRCGRPSLSGTLQMVLGQTGDVLDWANHELLPGLSAYTRQASERGEQVSLDTDNWRDLARAHLGTPIRQKLRKLLALAATRSLGVGEAAELRGDDDYPAVDARSKNEFDYLLQHLQETGLVTFEDGALVALTVKGWEALEPTSGHGIPGRCFVAMSFHESLEDAWRRGIYLAVKDDCKCEPIRIDKVHHNEKICDKIVAEIHLAQFVVADVTRQRPGVYFEAGFAMALGRPVIWTCREDDRENVHFDTRQYNHIFWSSPEKLREQLADRIRATIPS